MGLVILIDKSGKDEGLFSTSLDGGCIPSSIAG